MLLSDSMQIGEVGSFPGSTCGERHLLPGLRRHVSEGFERVFAGGVTDCCPLAASFYKSSTEISQIASRAARAKGFVGKVAYSTGSDTDCPRTPRGPPRSPAGRPQTSREPARPRERSLQRRHLLSPEGLSEQQGRKDSKRDPGSEQRAASSAKRKM